jgi:Uma2 family endonuclease
VASAVAECRWPQQEAWAAVESPVSVEAAELPEAQESRVVDRTPQVSRYSGSLFRQPLLLASCPNPGLVGIAQNAQQKQGIQTHSFQTVNGPFARIEHESTGTSALNKYPCIDTRFPSESRRKAGQVRRYSTIRFPGLFRDAVRIHKDMSGTERAIQASACTVLERSIITGMTRNADYLEVIERLPAGAVLVVPGVEWEAYEKLLTDLEVHPALRVSYDAGNLEVTSPLPEHEICEVLLSCLARAFAEETGTPLENLGSTTWKHRKLRKGIEPDGCFYVANASRVIGKPTIDLDVDPPPDIAVEIDTTHASLAKFPIYAALGVPEIWRCDGSRVEFYSLQEGAYISTETSTFLVGLSSATLTEFLRVGKAQGQTRALELFRHRLRSGKT